LSQSKLRILSHLKAFNFFIKINELYKAALKRSIFFQVWKTEFGRSFKNLLFTSKENIITHSDYNVLVQTSFSNWNTRSMFQFSCLTKAHFIVQLYFKFQYTPVFLYCLTMESDIPYLKDIILGLLVRHNLKNICVLSYFHNNYLINVIILDDDNSSGTYCT
jgi:hypothetical protein